MTSSPFFLSWPLRGKHINEIESLAASSILFSFALPDLFIRVLSSFWPFTWPKISSLLFSDFWRLWGVQFCLHLVNPLPCFQVIVLVNVCASRWVCYSSTSIFTFHIRVDTFKGNKQWKLFLYPHSKGKKFDLGRGGWQKWSKYAVILEKYKINCFFERNKKHSLNSRAHKSAQEKCNTQTTCRDIVGYKTFARRALAPKKCKSTLFSLNRNTTHFRKEHTDSSFKGLHTCYSQSIFLTQFVYSRSFFEQNANNVFATFLSMNREHRDAVILNGKKWVRSSTIRAFV